MNGYNTKTIINSIKNYFIDNCLDTAIIGYSGGIDSSVTAALCSKAGLNVELIACNAIHQFYDNYGYVVCEQNIQKNSSFYPIDKFAKQFNCKFSIYNILSDKDKLNEFKEAALPIQRVATFYGKAAELRVKGLHPIVVGTVNFDEGAYLGFWGKASDAAQDYYPISHLHKSEIIQIAKELKIPDQIINAVPSGDLLWSGDLNDHKMIGATYDQIEAISKIAETPNKNLIDDLTIMINSVDNKDIFIDNILRNYHKYKIRMNGIHLDDRLEKFRKHNYMSIYYAAEKIKNSIYHKN